jgi:hypothetical protein
MTSESKGKQRGATKTGRAKAEATHPGKPENETAQKRLQEIKETSPTRGNR